MTDVDKTLAEIDLLAIADAVGVYRSGPTELGPRDPATPDTPTQRASRQRQAAARATSRDHRQRHARALDRQLDVSPYPDVYKTYCTSDIWEPEPTEAQVRDAANDLVGMGWPVDIVSRLLRIPPRPRP